VKTRSLILLAGIGLCGVLCFLVSRSLSRGSVYQGKTVRTWLVQLSTAPTPQARAEAEAAFKALGTNAVPELARLVRADDARWRSLIWSHTGHLPRQLRALLLRQAGTPNAYLVRPAAARVLAALGPGAASAEPDLVQALQDKVNGTYWEAGTALGRIGQPSVADLTRALQDRDTLVRCAAAHGLGEAGPAAAPAVPALLQLLKHGNPNEQQGAAQSLARIGAPAVSPLLDLLLQDEGAIAQAAAGALLRYYSRTGPHPRAIENLPPDDTASARQQAMARLGTSSLPDELVVKLLAGAAADDPAPGVRVAALQALAQGNRSARLALPALVACVRDDSPAIRQWTARALGTITPPCKPAVGGLARLEQDQDESVRAAAKAALASLTPAGTTNLLAH